MEIVLAILAFLAGVIATVLLIAVRKPDTAHIQRSAYIDAPASAIFPFVNDLRAHTSWSPFNQDPNIIRHDWRDDITHAPDIKQLVVLAIEAGPVVVLPLTWQRAITGYVLCACANDAIWSEPCERAVHADALIA